MHSHALRWLLVTAAVGYLVPISYGSGFEDDFSTDPFARWSIADGPGEGFGDNSNAQIAYDGTAHELLVHYDSSQLTVRLQRSLEAVLTPDRAFKFSAVLRIDSLIAPPEDFMQVCVALTNSDTTGGVRAGASIQSANTFDNLELAYFPNTSIFGGPFVTLSVQGSPQGAEHAFAHFGFTSNETALPVGEPMEWRGAYTPVDRLVHFRTSSGVQLTQSLDAGGFFDPPGTFSVDTFAITSYFDGADLTPPSVSLLADVAYLHVSWLRCGDADADEDIDLADAAAAQNCFGQTVADRPECDAADFDDDGTVAIPDHASFAAVMTGP